MSDDELIERLRWRRQMYDVGPICVEAADALTRLEAENARLRAALKPFAKFAEAERPGTHEKCLIGFYAHGTLTFGPHSPNVGDLRRARAALTQEPTDEGR